MEWRKSYHEAPPATDDEEVLRKLGKECAGTSTSSMDPRYVETGRKDNTSHRSSSESSEFLGLPLPQEFPRTESLQMCQVRAMGYWNEVIAPRVKKGERVLIVVSARRSLKCLT